MKINTVLGYILLVLLRTWNISHLYLSVTLDAYLVVGELFSLNYRDPHLLRTALLESRSL
jgi:hypothetical protein